MDNEEQSGQEFSKWTHEEVLELLPAFVVGALDPDEMLNVEEYIHAHPELMPRVHELELAAAKLAYVAPAQPLPRDLHDKVMIRARASLQPRPQGIPAQPRVPVPPPRHAPRASGFANWWRKRALFDLSMVAAVAAAIVLAIFYRDALVQVNMLRAQLQTLEQEIASVQERNTQLENENVRLQGELDTRVNQLAAIGGAQDVVALGGTDAAPTASGTLYVNETSGTLVLSNLQALEEDQIYQLWLIPPDGPPIPAGLLDQVGTDVQTISLTLPTTLDGVAAVGVSIEPPGGSTAPTGPIVLLGENT